MSLHRALEALSDDREAVTALRRVVAFISQHPREPLTSARIAHATGLAEKRVEVVTKILADSYVLDCVDSDEPEYTYPDTPVLKLEIRRFLHTMSSADSRLQNNTQRFRDRYAR